MAKDKIKEDNGVRVRDEMASNAALYGASRPRWTWGGMDCERRPQRYTIAKRFTNQTRTPSLRQVMASSLEISDFVDLTQKSFYISLASITFNPTWWNIVAQNEYRNKTITGLLRGNARLGCYVLAVAIFTLGLVRDTLFKKALEDQPTYSLLPSPLNVYVPAALMVTGQVLVLSSTWALGITGTFLGDYFGILMDHRVEGFPFNVVENPMYIGSTLCFIGGSLWLEKPAGLLISVYVYIVYLIALRFEGPFTSMIYSTREKSKSSKKEL